MSTTSRHLTPTEIAGHLACQHLTQLESLRRGGKLDIKFLPDPRLDTMVARGKQHEKDYVDRLRKTGRSICDLSNSEDPAATLAAMQQGHGAIIQAPLGNDSFRGRADALLRVETQSSLGAYSYEPVDTKLARETKAGTILQLVAYCELLEPLQQVPPAQFHVVTPVAEERYRPADYGAYFRFVRGRLQAAVTASPPPTTYPDPVPHCEICGYWKYCEDRRRADDHLSLVANIRTAHIRELQRQGIATMAGLAACKGSLPDKPKRGNTETFLRLGQQAQLQLVAKITGHVPFVLLDLDPVRGLARLPEPSPGDVFLDFEGDPFAGDKGIEYLTGWCVRDPTGELVYEHRWALTSAEERTACQAFLDFAMARLRTHAGLHIYHYGAYEPSALKRLVARHDTRAEDLDRLLRGGRFIDLLAVVREGLRIGVENYGLKQLEPLHGFTRALDLHAASIARCHLEIALEVGDRERINAELQQQVAAYNRDDCSSTASLRGWLETQRDTLVHLGKDLPRPVSKEGEASEQVKERDRRITELAESLRQGLPDNPDARTDDQKAKALLASMLGYFRREEKSNSWEHFRLRELPPEEHLAEREMLGGLEFSHVVPKQPGEKVDRYAFHFPPQECVIEAGKQVVFTKAEDPRMDGKTTEATVESIDPVAGTVTLVLPQKAQAARPRAVFLKRFIGPASMENALLSFGERVRDHGFPTNGLFAAASQLLLRHPPRRRAGTTACLPCVSVDMQAAAVRVCGELNHGALPIQGPPGSGKTYTGGRAIVALVQAGMRVGITAVSHKVIDNLLEEVRDVAAKEHFPIRLLHEDDSGDSAGIEYTKDKDIVYAAIGARTVVGGTGWLWAHDRFEGSLDYLFVDEAGQMALACVLAAARAATNLVLLGDPQQLDQPQKGAHPDGADVSALAHVIGINKAVLNNSQGLFLRETRRLHPSLCKFTSELYYNDELCFHRDCERQELRGATSFAGAGPFLAEVIHEGNQAQAPEEVEAIVAIVQSLLQPTTTWVDKDGIERPLTPQDILVVAPYNLQVGALRRRLAAFGVTGVGTVDKFQGQEAPIVIYSCTSSSPQDAPRGMHFLYDPHRFNVATSRAQGVVIVVASPRLFEPDCRTPEQMLWANGLCRYRELAKRAPI